MKKTLKSLLDKLEAMMGWLKIKLPFLENPWCQIAIGIIVFLNPVAMMPQVINVFTSSPKELAGISIFTFILFALIQIGVAGSAIRSGDWKLFGSMAISFVQSITVALVVFLRT